MGTCVHIGWLVGVWLVDVIICFIIDIFFFIIDIFVHRRMMAQLEHREREG